MKNIKETSMYLWIDIDCYECQVWSRLHPEYQKGPLIVTSGNESREMIISCDYEGKSYGINKTDSVESAKTKCPSLKVFRKRNTTDEPEELNRTRSSVELSIKNFIQDIFNNANKFNWEGNEEGFLNVGDEVDLQISSGVRNFQPNAWKTNAKWIFGIDEDQCEANCDDNKRLQVGVNILAEILSKIECDTGLYASGSVGATKTVARLSCQLNKPRGITVVTAKGLNRLFALVKIVDAPGLKGKVGKKILNKWKKSDGSSLETVQDLKENVTLAELQAENYLKGNKLLYALISHWEDINGAKRKTRRNQINNLPLD